MQLYYSHVCNVNQGLALQQCVSPKVHAARFEPLKSGIKCARTWSPAKRECIALARPIRCNVQ